MSLYSSQQKHQDIEIRFEQVKFLFSEIEQEIKVLKSQGELAPEGCWIAPLNEPNSRTFYWQGFQEPEIGYTDYPVLSLLTSA